jgi:hypothetical protein
MFQTEVAEKIKTRLNLNNFLPENRAVCETMWKNMVEPGNIIPSMRFSFRINKL